MNFNEVQIIELIKICSITEFAPSERLKGEKQNLFAILTSINIVLYLKLVKIANFKEVV